MAELKPCECGRTDMNVLFVELGPGWACLIGCMNIDCDATVIRYGLTRKQSERRAVLAWNQQVERRRENGHK